MRRTSGSGTSVASRDCLRRAPQNCSPSLDLPRPQLEASMTPILAVSVACLTMMLFGWDGLPSAADRAKGLEIVDETVCAATISYMPHM